MKKILILGLLLCTVNFAKAQEKIEWLKFEEAVAATEANPKMLLVDVYTDWCGWCKKMDKETFTDPAVIQYINERFYAVKMNAEDTKRTFDFKGKEYSEAQMAATMRVRSYPNFVIIDPTLKNITQLPGYRQPAEFLDGLGQIIENGFGAK
ncbi:thioredoxin fold domain-containing protein [Algoriphagus halophytocola]|uniref:Thioredoxin fold domain-containing protein n=1 Tax=Algoriphagus halophytocola TaxID=2991499 RepID=A0ABY6MK32_9BACT|nr:MULTISPECIES: thioredoxin fold domain-containing protein [unclassified Algoriphagus]UZD23533.1 thioredoxin fold domain-containing protein [Algoriphagus sp. TR-M5]WBL44827.1 thioredoxin fold domain-containing protein [Algoriphagus sp. TR-M9]